MTARRGRDRKAEMLQPPPGRAILPPATPPRIAGAGGRASPAWRQPPCWPNEAPA
jgi:hypothetical protein